MNSLPWIERAADAPYFTETSGAAWTPIGQNDAITWPELAGLSAGAICPAWSVTALAEGQRRHLLAADAGILPARPPLPRAPPGRFNPALVRLWDDLVALCEAIGLRLLLTPFDTFFLWNRWKHHPYNRANGGPCASRRKLLVCPATRQAVKARLAFATERWGGSGVFFAWDLWNEMHPAQAGDDPDGFAHFIDDVGPSYASWRPAARPRASADCISLRPGARKEAVAERADLPPSRPRLRQQPFL